MVGEAQSAPSRSPQELRRFVASFNRSRPRDFTPLLVEDVLCSEELKAEVLPLGRAFPRLPDTELPNDELMREDKPTLRLFRQMLAGVVARRKGAQVKRAAARSTRFGPAFRELGHNILIVIFDIDKALKIEDPQAYYSSALHVREDAHYMALSLGHSATAFRRLAFEYRTVAAIKQGKPRPSSAELQGSATQPD